MTALAVVADVIDDGPARHRDWDVVVAHAPVFAATAWRYLDELAVSMRPATVDVADNTLRCFAGFIVAEHPDLTGFVDVRRVHVDGFKLFFVAHITAAGKPPARNTVRQRFGMLRSFFDRIIEWDWDDAPQRIPIFTVDVPVADDPLPRFLDDVQAARLAAAAAIAAPFDRLVIELLSRTGMRAGELCTLASDAVVELNGAPWIRVPVGKLHNDRNVPLHPNAARLLAEWVTDHPPVDDAYHEEVHFGEQLACCGHTLTRDRAINSDGTEEFIGFADGQPAACATLDQQTQHRVDSADRAGPVRGDLMITVRQQTQHDTVLVEAGDDVQRRVVPRDDRLGAGVVRVGLVYPATLEQAHRDDNFGGTSTTCSPAAATSCWASNAPIPVAPLTAQMRGSNAVAHAKFGLVDDGSLRHGSCRSPPRPGRPQLRCGTPCEGRCRS